VGLFFENEMPGSAAQRLLPHFMTAVALDSADPQTSGKAVTIAGDAAKALLGGAKFKTGRFFIALAIFALLVVGGILTDVNGHAGSSTALFGFAGTVFGVVTAFLGTEKSASGG
jgi:hypothetical protein